MVKTTLDYHGQYDYVGVMLGQRPATLAQHYANIGSMYRIDWANSSYLLWSCLEVAVWYKSEQFYVLFCNQGL